MTYLKALSQGILVILQVLLQCRMIIEMPFSIFYELYLAINRDLATSAKYNPIKYWRYVSDILYCNISVLFKKIVSLRYNLYNKPGYQIRTIFLAYDQDKSIWVTWF